MAAQKMPQAQSKVPSYIQPRDCFVVYANNKRGWEPLDGTPCAHYVAHLLGLKANASNGGYGCNEGYELRVKALVKQLSEVALADVKLNDVWARLKGESQGATSSKEPSDHCGLVTKMTPATAAGGKPTIEITHNSNRQRAVAKNDWKDYFNEGGKFYRPASQGASVVPPGVQANQVRAANALPLRAARSSKA